jgi:hypothetical protein
MTGHRRFLLPTRLVSVLAGLLTVVFGGSSSSGQTPTPRKPAIAAPTATTAAGGNAGAGGAGGAAAEAPKVKVERGAGGKKVYRITEEIRIEGKIQKPEAFFFYQKSSINYDWQELKQDVIPRIIDSVSRAPF